MHFANTHLVAALLLLIAKGIAAAEDDKTEFAFNLFSDIAPIFALFGDQFARQFLSEGFTWLDHFIFACVPLGILTALTGAIRVQGPRIARSFIGRGRENRATAELELMSSTSQEVCEMFNGKGIIRTTGRPKIAQFIIFPDRYDDLMGKPGGIDKSCGIHTLQTAVEPELGCPSIMTCKAYHSKSYRFAAQLLRDMRNKIFSPAKPNPEDGRKHCSSRFPSQAPPNLQLNVSSGNRSERKKGVKICITAFFALLLQLSLLVIAAVTVYHKPTRTKIGHQPERYSLPSYITGSVFLFIGMAICSWSIENSTVEFKWERHIEDGKTVQQNDKELSQRPEKTDDTNGKSFKRYPRLVWLQQCQQVNDQAFDSFAILGGSKRYVITSNRREDVHICEQSNDEKKAVQAGDRGSSTPTSNSVCIHDPYSNHGEQPNRPGLELLTVMGAISGGIGFVVQFMGLRGLSWPCSISQLGAILFMALARAIMRRRLARPPFFCPALPKYELDLLAARIVYNVDFREFDNDEENADAKRKTAEIYKRLHNAKPKMICKWTVTTPGASKRFTLPITSGAMHANKKCACGGDFNKIRECVGSTVASESGKPVSKVNPVSTVTLYRDAQGENSSSGISPSRSSTESKTDSNVGEGDGFCESSSENLIRVRERLGNLCRWTNCASSAALALAQSIEKFMMTFFPVSDNETVITWVIETTKIVQTGISSKPENVELFLVFRDNRWSVEIGKIEAIISLWLASIEADTISHNETDISNADESSKADGSADWRRSRAGVGSKVDYRRIVGDNYKDDVLERDINWWVGELSADQIEEEGSKPKSPPLRGGERKHVIGFNGLSEEKPARKREDAREMSMASSGHLPVIFAQHLFTSFMWTVASHIPWDFLRDKDSGGTGAIKIDLGTFSPYEFRSTWYYPKLKSVLLDKFVKYAEAAGLGSVSDILLCMVPALSFNDRLPNEKMLSLMVPLDFQQIQIHGWARTATFYHELLELSTGADIDDFFAVAAVVKSMDFIYFAYQPFTRSIEPDEDLARELKKVVERLAQGFATTLEHLSPVYEMQRRSEIFRAIFEEYANIDKANIDKLFAPRGRKDRLEEGYRFLDKIGVTSRHRSACEGGNSSEGSKAKQPREKQLPEKQAREKDDVDLDQNDTEKTDAKSKEDVKKSDIFGWTVLHYAAAGTDLNKLKTVWASARCETTQPIHRWQNNLKRSPIHLAALCGNHEFLDFMISTVNKAEKKSDVTLKNNAKSEAATSAVKAKGIDGMTPIHLAVKGKHQKCVETLLQHHKPADFDVWGRAPIHLAAVAADINIAKKLLREDSRPDQVDLFGRTPLTYLKFAKDRERADDQNMAKEFMRFWKNFDTKDDNGMTVLHYAVEFLDGRDIEERYLLKGATVNTVDKLGRTPLHVAVLASREGAVKALLKHKANPSTQDLSGMTPLHAAIGADNDSISLILLENRADPGIVDANGMTPLIVAAKEGLCLKAARHIIREYPEVANKGDDDYDQPPIAWACECGEQETVELLLADKNVDPNRPARKWGNRTPLHIALMNGHTSIVSKLLNNVQVAFNWNVPKVSEGKGLESLQHALDDSGAEYFAEMLVHPKISTSTRIVALKTMVVTSRYTNDTFKRILNTVGEHDITSSELDELIRRFLRLDQNNPVLEKWMERVEDPMEWQKLACPLHILAQIGEETKLLNLVNWGANVLETDTDNWTCIDVAERNGHLDLSNRLIKLVTTDPSKNPRYARPSNFSERSDVATLSLESCSQCTTASSPCLMSQEIRVNDEESTFGKICLCTKESIPPDISWFYFEVQVLAIPGASRYIAVGFTQVRIPDGEYPGMVEGSWAYHADDGKLYVKALGEDGFQGSVDEGIEYGEHDVVGCGLNMKTGEGYHTLNGRRLDSETLFNDRKFNKGKVYPYVGFYGDSGEKGLHLRVVFGPGPSNEHQFVYEGDDIQDFSLGSLSTEQ